MDGDQKASAQSRKSSPTHTGRRYLEKVEVKRGVGGNSLFLPPFSLGEWSLRPLTGNRDGEWRVL